MKDDKGINWDQAANEPPASPAPKAKATPPAKAQATPVAKAKQTPVAKVKDMLEQYKGNFQPMLPKGLTPERFVAIAGSAVAQTPKLAKCDMKSLFGAMVSCAQLGLEPNNVNGYAYLIPYGTTCQLIIGYKGLIQLLGKAGCSVNAHVVFENDLFEMELGDNETVKHVPTPFGKERGPWIGAYAIVRLPTGHKVIRAMGKDEILAARPAKWQGTPWNKHEDEMALKTVIRRVAKLVPSDFADVNRAVVIDEASDRNASFVFDAEGGGDEVTLTEREGSKPAELEAPNVDDF